jgi:hypothetical protein
LVIEKLSKSTKVLKVIKAILVEKALVVVNFGIHEKALVNSKISGSQHKLFNIYKALESLEF